MCYYLLQFHSIVSATPTNMQNVLNNDNTSAGKMGRKILTCHLKIQLETEIRLAASKTTKTESFCMELFFFAGEAQKLKRKLGKIHVKLMKKTCFTSNYAHIVDFQQFPHFPAAFTSETRVRRQNTPGIW